MKDQKKFLFLLFGLISTTILLYNSVNSLTPNNPHEKVETSIIDEISRNNQSLVIITLNKNADMNVVLSNLNNGFKLRRKFIPSNWFSGVIMNASTLDIIDRISDIKMVYRLPLGKPALSESVPLINTTAVWLKQIATINITGRDETVCIIDTGINSQHPDLTNKILVQHCYCNYGYEGCCSDGNNESDDASGNDVHGTRVAGIVAANGAIKGVGLETKIAFVRTCYLDFCALDDAKAALDWCISHKDEYNISIVSMSLGWYDSNVSNCLTFFDDEINNATSKNMTIIASSGNEGYTNTMRYPACSENVISVGATYDASFATVTHTSGNCTDNNPYADDIVCFTNRNEELDLLAPGDYINSTCTVDVPYCSGNGTSFAAPHVSGATSLLIQYEKNFNKTLTPSEIRNRFRDTGKIIIDNFSSANNGVGTNLSFFRIDVYAALFPIDVFDFQRPKASYNHNIVSFKIQNNYNNQTKDVSWSFDIGNGTTITSNQNITLQPKETVFVYFEHNYTDGDIYSINTTAFSGGDSDLETMNLTLGDLIAYDMRLLGSSSRERFFGFKILNNMNSSKGVNWTLNTGQGVISANNPVYLDSGKTAFLYVGYNYTASGTYTVNATAWNSIFTDSTGNVMLTVS